MMSAKSTASMVIPLLLAFFVAGLGGCASHDPFTGLDLGPPQLHSEMTVAEFHEALEGRVPPAYPDNIDKRKYTPSSQLYYQFLIRRDDREYRCYTADIFTSEISYYFLFESDRLLKIVEPPPFKTVPVEHPKSKQGPFYDWAPVDPEQRVDETLSATAIPFDQFGTIVLDHVERLRPDSRLAMPIEVHIIDALIPFDEWASYKSKLAGYKLTSDAIDLANAAAMVKLQMTPTQVEEVLGTPIISRTISKVEHVNVYSQEGNSIESGHGPYVAIHYVENSVFAMYQGEFFFNMKSLPLVGPARMAQIFNPSNHATVR